jgi:hypothetical protein
MNHGLSAQFLKLPELVSKFSVMLSVREIIDALYQRKRQLMLILMSGGALRLRISFRWPMKVAGMTTISAAGLQFPRRQEEPSILCRMGCCSEVIYISYLRTTLSRLTLMYVCYIFCKDIGLMVILG